MSGVSAIEFKGVSKNYGTAQVLNNFHLSIPNGKIVTLIGPSGCGKTTSLKMINRLIEPDSGTILVEGKDISQMNPVELRRNIGYVIQQIGLFPHMTIEDNISVVPRLKGERRNSLIGRTEKLLQLIDLDFESFRHRYPHELSGGQQQRIGVARALAADPSIILMDEPFSALDPISRVQLQNELMMLNQTLNKTIVFVTHDIDEALKIADIIVLLKDGKIVQVATPTNLLDKPANDFVRTFVGEERFRNSTVPMQKFQTNHGSIPQSLSISSCELLTTAVERMKHSSEEVLVVTDKNSLYLGVVYLTDVNATLKDGTEVTIEGVLRRDYPMVTEMTSTEEIFRLLTNHSLVPVIDEQHRLIRVLAREGVLNVLTNHTKREEVTT